MAISSRTRSTVRGLTFRLALALIATAIQQGCMLNPNKYDMSHLPAPIYGTPDEDQPFVPGPEFKLTRQAAATQADQADAATKPASATNAASMNESSDGR